MPIGKVLAQRIVPARESAADPRLQRDSSTNTLVRRHRQQRGNGG